MNCSTRPSGVVAGLLPFGDRPCRAGTQRQIEQRPAGWVGTGDEAASDPVRVGEDGGRGHGWAGGDGHDGQAIVGVRAVHRHVPVRSRDDRLVMHTSR